MRRGALEKLWFADLEESLDENFPKGKCKERGAALVFFADAFQLIDKTVKAFGGCDKCFGKGYGTKTEFASSGVGWRNEKPKSWRLNPLVPCTCPRGKQLKKLLGYQLSKGNKT